MAKTSVQEKPEFGKMKLDSKDYVKEYHKALSYCHYEVNIAQIVKASQQWAKSNTDCDCKLIFSLPDYYFESVGKFCYMMLKGAEFTPENKAKIVEVFRELENRAKIRKDDKVEDDAIDQTAPVKKVVGIQEYMRDKARDVCGEIEGWVDEYISTHNKDSDLRNRDVKVLFELNNLKSSHMRFVTQFYEPVLAELKELQKDECPDLKEAYQHLNKTQVKRLIEFYENVLSVAGHLKASGVANKKPRLKKATDINKRVSKMKYLVESTELDIKSINPVHIVGAKEVWVFNTKTRKLGCYYASSDVGLSVKGTSIQNFSVKSVERTIRKGSSLDLKKFCKMKAVDRKSAFSAVKTMEITSNGRINEHMLILAVEK